MEARENSKISSGKASSVSTISIQTRTKARNNSLLLPQITSKPHKTILKTCSKRARLKGTNRNCLLAKLQKLFLLFPTTQILILHNLGITPECQKNCWGWRGGLNSKCNRRLSTRIIMKGTFWAHRFITSPRLPVFLKILKYSLRRLLN